jgi:hypothetical protein
VSSSVYRYPARTRTAVGRRHHFQFGHSHVYDRLICCATSYAIPSWPFLPVTEGANSNNQYQGLETRMGHCRSIVICPSIVSIAYEPNLPWFSPQPVYSLSISRRSNRSVFLNRKPSYPHRPHLLTFYDILPPGLADFAILLPFHPSPKG